MAGLDLNQHVKIRGREFLSSIRQETPSVFDRNSWVGKALSWCMENDDFRVRLFRFVDVYPALQGSETLAGHLREYLEGAQLPPLMRWGLERAEKSSAAALVLAGLVSLNVGRMARMFIIGETEREAIATLTRLREEGFAATVDILGEASISEEEAENYALRYHSLLDALREGGREWAPLGHHGRLDWGCAPRINVSVKPTSLFSEARPLDFEGSVRGILARLDPLYRKVIDTGGFLCIDMEASQYKDLTLEVYRRLRAAHPSYPHLGIALQSYLRDTDRDLPELIAWARKRSLPISVRLVKGAYWDQEVVRSAQNGWESPVWMLKAETDAAFERQAALILENSDICGLACGSHNIRSISAVLEKALALGVPAERYEFQVLYGMAEPIRRGLRNVAERVRLYAPFGGMAPGMGYLVRRLLENTSNESFLRQTYAEGVDEEILLADPVERIARERDEKKALQAVTGTGGVPGFRNEPAADFSRREVREAFAGALKEVRGRLGQRYPLFIGGREVETAPFTPSVNPADPAEVVGRVSDAGTAEVVAALQAARRAFPAWRDAGPEARAELLRRTAEAARRRIYELSAWQVLEIGKQWDQAHADVAEAIDFLEYYAGEMLRLGRPLSLGEIPGEDNRQWYEPRGVAAVIAPWNFPLAISCGMTAAALAAGNTVLYKPSGLTPVTGALLCELYREGGIPAGVFNFVPGRSGDIGDLLVTHPEVDLIAFTGSLEVGLRIVERAAPVVPRQRNLKRVICEMGGKNAVIIDGDADLDEAVPAVIASAFGFQGQKCSACSRVIVVDAVHDRFTARLIAALRTKRQGPAEDPAFFMGPLAEEAARRKTLDYIEMGRKEGRLLYLGEAPSGGYYAPIAVFGDIEPHHRLGQEEIFGPVLAVMRARDFDQALEWANSTRFALTGGVFSRSPHNLEIARRQFRVGNLYLNRGVTGALVGRQPFGGARLSGGGTKAGGPDYLLHFMDPRVVTENTMRRGFVAPASGQSVQGIGIL